jgi:DNA-binding LacI/PurR family transcriptional regulator
MPKTTPPNADNAGSAQQRRLQMADIARLAGVSTSTVSRALAGSKLISEEYNINIGAQNLRMKQNRTVGVVIPYDPATRQHLSDPFFLSMLGSLADALTEQGFDMLVSRVDAEQLDAAGAPFDTGRVIGVVLIGQWRHHDQLNQLAARHVPVVVWGAQLPQQLYCTVGGDNLAGGELAGAHLIVQGRKRIAFFGDINLPEVGLRYEGQCRALAAAGMDADPALQVSVSFLPDGGQKAVQELLRRGVPFDAVFAGSDLMAMTTINTLRQHGLDVPGQVAVVGYDDIELSSYFHPPLTTVQQPIREAGRALVASLLALVDGEPAPSLQLPTQLIVRASSV